MRKLDTRRPIESRFRFFKLFKFNLIVKKVIIASIFILFSATTTFADWVRWQPTDFKDNGNGTYNLHCLNYAIVSCANHYGPSTSPTPGDRITVKGPDGVIGDFEILEVYSDTPDDGEGGLTPDVENLPSTFQVSKM